MKQIVIIGGGFAGTWAALAAARQINDNGAEVGVTIILADDYLDYSMYWFTTYETHQAATHC